MVWDKGEPQNSTKLRNAPGVIRDNWVAIEDASDFSFQPDALIVTDRSALAVTDDPSAAVSGGVSRGNGYTLFCKQDGAGNQELFGIDPAAVISQFTSTDRTLAADGHVLLPPGFLFQWGDDSIPSGTSATITFPKAFSATAWVVLLTLTSNPLTGSTPKVVGTRNYTSTTFEAAELNGTALNTPVTFVWMAVGPA